MRACTILDRGSVAILTDLVIVLGLILVGALFAGAEIAILSLRKSRLRELAEQGRRGARSIEALRDHPERFLATIQISSTVLSVLAAAYAGLLVATRLAAAFARLGLGRSSLPAALAIVVLALSYLIVVLGGLVPKSLALRAAEGYALLVARPLRAMAWLFRPLVWLLTASSNVVLRLFGDRTTFTESRLSPEELQQLVEEAARTGSLDPRAGEIASRAFDFSSLVASAVMVPRSRIVAIRRHASQEEVQQVLTEQGHSRMPVYDDSLDNIVGYVIAKDVLAMAWEKHLIVLEDIVRPAFFVPQTMRAVDVLQELQRRHSQMAIVVDEQGGVAGLVTIEDLVEEIVGEIFSEHEVPVQLVRREADGTAIVQGTAPIREVNRELALDLQEGEGWSTIAGLCIALAGWIPQRGAKFTAQDGTDLEVVDASPRRVRLVRVRPKPPPPPEES